MVEISAILQQQQVLYNKIMLDYGIFSSWFYIISKMFAIALAEIDIVSTNKLKTGPTVAALWAKLSL